MWVLLLLSATLVVAAAGAILWARAAIRRGGTAARLQFIEMALCSRHLLGGNAPAPQLVDQDIETLQDDEDPVPEALDEGGIQRVVTAFADAARRAMEAGADFVEIHAAHGYLLHQFLSPLCNERDDAYGGSFDNRMRFAREVIDAVRSYVGMRSVTMAKELPDCEILAIDVSSDAIEVARKNADDLGASEKIRFVQSDYFGNIPDGTRFDLILANPPYISDEEYKSLPPEVLADPRISLTSGEEGLDAVKTILKGAPNYLAGGGRIMFEIGYNQADRVTQLTAEDDRYKSIVILKDLNDIDRVVILACD